MLEQVLTFSSDCDDNFFTKVPAAPAVFLLRGEGEPYVSKTANLRRRLQRLLGMPAEQSKRLNLRERVQEVGFTLTGSDFESQLLLYKLLREYFSKTYAARLRLRPAALVKLHLENEYPRASVTTRLGRSTGKDAFYGPFPSRAAAEKFASDALDFFKMRRCVDDLHPDPSFPGTPFPRHAAPRHAGEDGGYSGLGSRPTARCGSACLSASRCAGTASPRSSAGRPR